MKLQKWIASLGRASRHEAERWIIEGRVEVNGQTATKGQRVVPGKDRVTVDGRPLVGKPATKLYLLLNKPDLYLSSRKSQGDKPTIYDLPSLKTMGELVHPVGRLDLRSEGLLILTNDGELANRITHPRYKLPKHYSVLINRRLTGEELRLVNAKGGMILPDRTRIQAKVKFVDGYKLGATSGAWYTVSVAEGRKHIVRHIFSRFECRVLRLFRFAIGDLHLPPDLRPGKCRRLTGQELQYLRKATGLEEGK